MTTATKGKRALGPRPARHGDGAMLSRKDLSLLHEIAVAANESARPLEMLGFSLERLSRDPFWSLGHAFALRRHPEPHLRSAIWKCPESGRFASFRRLTLASSFGIGEGLVGKVAKQRRPCWVENVARSSPPIRFGDVGEEITSGLIVPVVIRPEPTAVAVLELYSARRRRPSTVRVRLVTSICAMLARIFERDRADQRLVEAREAEQQRIGRELHDTISQELTGIAMMAERMSEAAAELDSDHAARFEKLTEHLRQTRRRIHALSRGLLPLDIGPTDLRSALEFLAAQVRECHGLECRLECDERLELEDAPTANHLARIVQEAVQNAAKYAGAESVRIGLKRRAHRITLTVEDDGVGFSTRRTGEGGVGFRLMRHRAAAIGAKLTVKSRVGRGTIVRCSCSV